MHILYKLIADALDEYPLIDYINIVFLMLFSYQYLCQFINLQSIKL